MSDPKETSDRVLGPPMLDLRPKSQEHAEALEANRLRKQNRLPEEQRKLDNAAAATVPSTSHAVASFANFANSERTARVIHTAPPLPDEVYAHLPVSLTHIVQRLDDVKERDLFLLGVLPVLAGCMPRVGFRYGGEVLALNINVMVVAPAGSGKGSLRRARRAGEKLDATLHKASEAAMSAWTKDSGVPLPPYRTLFVGGDASAAALKQRIAANPHAVMFETETLSITTALGQEWGAFRDVLLKSFPNEPVSIERRDAPPLRIERPALSMVASGTPSSVPALIVSAEDGLFSRVLFYAFDAAPCFLDQFGDDEEDEALENATDELGERLEDIYNRLSKRENDLKLKVSPYGREAINEAGRAATQHVRSIAGKECLLASVNRVAPMAVRIAAALSVLRMSEQGRDSVLLTASTLEVCDDDVETGILIAFGCLDHASSLLPLLHQSQAVAFVNAANLSKMKLLDALPFGSFTTKLAKVISKGLGISERSTDGYLKELARAEHIKDEGFGKWSKHEPDEPVEQADSTRTILDAVRKVRKVRNALQFQGTGDGYDGGEPEPFLGGEVVI